MRSIKRMIIKLPKASINRSASVCQIAKLIDMSVKDECECKCVFDFILSYTLSIRQFLSAGKIFPNFWLFLSIIILTHVLSENIKKKNLNCKSNSGHYTGCYALTERAG